jgi:hypothetical protein
VTSLGAVLLFGAAMIVLVNVAGELCDRLERFLIHLLDDKDEP